MDIRHHVNENTFALSHHFPNVFVVFLPPESAEEFHGQHLRQNPEYRKSSECAEDLSKVTNSLALFATHIHTNGLFFSLVLGKETC